MLLEQQESPTLLESHPKSCSPQQFPQKKSVEGHMLNIFLLTVYGVGVLFFIFRSYFKWHLGQIKKVSSFKRNPGLELSVMQLSMQSTLGQ
jgi:hypothetical protein